MQETIDIGCSNCGLRLHVTLDLGMTSDSLDAVIPLARGRLRQRLKGYAIENDGVEVEYKRRLMACPDCDTLHARFYVRFDRNEGTVYETVFRCGKCRSLLVEPAKAITDHRCAACGQKTLLENRSDR